MIPDVVDWSVGTRVRAVYKHESRVWLSATELRGIQTNKRDPAVEFEISFRIN